MSRKLSTTSNGGSSVGLAFRKRSAKKRTHYDKSQLDIAVDLVLKNKLSLRAAAHIYKIPFSTLRTRKIFVAQHPEEMKSSSSSCSNNLNEDDDMDDEDDDDQYEDIDDDNEEDDDDDDEQNENDNYCKSSEILSNENENNRNKPLKLHNVKSLNNPKTEALIAQAAATNNKPSLNSIIDRLKNSKFKLKFNRPSVLSGRIGKKPLNKNYNPLPNKPTKRLYIKHDKLDNLFQTNGISVVNDLLDNDNKNIHELLAETNKSKSNNKSKNVSINNTSRNNNDENVNNSFDKTKSQPFRLSSILSSTTLSMKNNKQNKSLNGSIVSPKQVLNTNTNKVNEKQQMKSTNDSNLTQSKLNNDQINDFDNFESNIMNNDNSSSEISMLDSLKKYLIQINSSSNDKNQSEDTNNNLIKCKICKLLFVDIRLLKEHQMNCNQDELCNIVNDKQQNQSQNNLFYYHQNQKHQHQQPTSANSSSDTESETVNSTSSNSSKTNKITLFKCSFCKKVYLNKISFISHAVLCTKGA